MLICSLQAREKIGLVLSGGGARGMAHIGVLKVLDELGIKPDYIAGTSTGALIAGLYACGMSGEEIEQLFVQIDWDSLLPEHTDRSQLHISEKRWAPLGNLSFELTEGLRPKLPQGFLHGNAHINILFKMFYPYIHVHDFDDLPIPFRCIGTNILTGEMKVFNSGSLHEAIRASMTFPSLLEPFNLDGQLYIDGGIMANLPTEVVQEMGADIIIGVQTNAGLKTEDQLENLIDVLDQTININIVRNIQHSSPNCDILIRPEIEDIGTTDFSNVEELIYWGEDAARNVTLQLAKLHSSTQQKPLPQPLPRKIAFSNIKVQGNLHMSSAKIREYVGLQKYHSYDLPAISAAFQDAYNSRLFKILYPTINSSPSGYSLTIHCVENPRYKLNLGFCYNDENELTAAATVSFTNTLQRNSKLLANVQVGARNECNVDYVKNFGNHWGIYFRLFPYIKEHTLYTYNQDHERLSSERSLEYGGTAGVGLFTRNAFIAEVYGYGFNSRSYRKIAEINERRYHSTGVGIKLYRESLDDYLLPTSGVQLMTKLTTTMDIVDNTEDYKKYYLRTKVLVPVTPWLSCKGQFEYGSFFRKIDTTFDPFYLGGIDSYPGLQRQEMSAPIFRYGILALRFHKRSFVYDLFVGSMYLGNTDVWHPQKYRYHCIGMQIGLKSRILPVRSAWTMDEEWHSTIHLSVGFEIDPFSFSRR